MSVDGTALRAIMRRYPTGIVVITTRGDGEVRGMTAGSFSSLSLTPPLVTFSVMNEARLLSALRAAAGFTVNILGDHQRDISDRFARPGLSGPEQFAGIAHESDGRGIPALAGCLGWLDCELLPLVPGGDHAIVLGRVTAIRQGQEGPPLLFHGGGYHRLGDPL